MQGLRGLEDDTASRRSRNVRQMTTPMHIITRIREIRKGDPEKSKYEIQAELRDGGILVGYNTIQKVINRSPELLNTQHKQKLKKKRHFQIARIKAAVELREQALGSLVQMDTKYFSILGQRFFIFSAIDCKSRFGFIYPYRTISSSSAADFVRRVKEYYKTDRHSEHFLR